jgi:methyl-accepting chemotaxis protein
MQFFRNLRLAVRLAIAFGALAVGLLLVGGVAVTAMGGLKDKTNTLGAHDLRATAIAGNLAERNATIGHLVAQHLYAEIAGAAQQISAETTQMESSIGEVAAVAEQLQALVGHFTLTA